MTGGPYFPLDELADAGRLPFGELLDEVLQHIWIANPGYDEVTDQGMVEVLIDEPVEVPVPGVPALTLALGDQPGGVNAELRARFLPSLAFTVELPLTLRVDGSVLRPLKPGTHEPDPGRKTLDITLGSVRVGYDADGGFILDTPGGLTLPRCMIGTTGVILSASDVRWLTPGSPNLPASVPPDFTGLHIDGASIELADLPVDPGKIEMTDVYLGTGGFSGAVSWTDTTVRWTGTAFQGIAAGGLLGFSGALTRVELSFRQNALTGCDIRGDVFLPYLERRIGLDLAIDGRGGFSVATGLPTSAPQDPKVTAGRAPGALLHLDLDVVQFDLDEVRFAAGGGGPASVSLTGRVKLDIEAINSPSLTFRKLTVDTDGNVTLDGGWLDIERAKSADIHGFALEITRIGFGSDPGGRMWVGLNGGIKLAEGLPMGASVEGLKVSWDPKAADVLSTVGVSLEGIGLDLEVPNAFRFSGKVALFQGDPEFGNGFNGRIILQLLPVKVRIDAQLLVGRTTDGVEYVFVYLGVDLPTGIPLFSTGASIFGFAGLVAVNLRPDRRGDESWWHGWYKRDPRGVLEPRRKWRVERGAFAVGLGTTIGTTVDDGFAFNLKVLLILALPGPVIFLQGKGSFVTKRADSQSPDSTGMFEALVVLDVPGKLFSTNLAAAYEKKNLLTIGGEVDAAFSWARVPPPDVWHLYVGEKEPPEKRVRGLLVKLLKIDTYFQLRGTGIALGGRIAFDGDWRFGPAHAWAHASLSVDAAVSWKPPQFDGSLALHGDAGIEAFGAKVVIILDAVVRASGPEPWYLGIFLHLEIVIDLWFYKFHTAVDVPLEWGRKDLPLPAPATPAVASVGARHPKVAEDVAVLSGRTIPPDSRPVVTFTRPVLDRGMVGKPTTGARPANVVGPRSFSYVLGHVVLAAGSAGGRRLIGAAGLLDVVGGTVRLPAQLSLPDVAGAGLEILPGLVASPITQAVTLPVTGRTAGGLAVTGSVPDGEYPYRLRAAPARADVQVTVVTPKLLGRAELTLAAGVPAGTFDGGTLALGGTTWAVLAAQGTTVTVATPAAVPMAGSGRLTGPPPPVVEGSWLPTDNRDEPQDPGATTSLVLWARTPYAWFRGSDAETYDGFDAHNPDYACGPEPTEEPICASFDDLPAGPLAGTFATELLTGDVTGDVLVIASVVNPADRRLEIGRRATGGSGHGVVELRFDPPVDQVLVHCWQDEGGQISVLSGGTVLASAPVPRKPDVVRFAGSLDTVRIDGTFVAVERICFTPGWTCVPFKAASFPQGSTGDQSYAGLTISSPAAMTVTGGELRVDPVTFVWSLGGGIFPPIPVTLAVITVRLPQPVTRVRFRVTADCLVWVTGNGADVVRMPAAAGQTVSVAARHGVIDRVVVLAQTRLGMTGPCYDAGPFGWQRQEQWTWRRSMRAATETLSRVDPVLAPGDYTLSVLTGVEITGASPGSEWDDQRDTTFTVGVPPGLTTPTGDPDADRHYPAGGVLADLTPYVDTTVPVAGERPAYRTYDVGVAFTEPYVSRMFLTAAAALTVAVVDPNAVDRRTGAPNVWGQGPEVRLGEQETRFVKTLHGDGTQICAPVDYTTLARDEGLSAGAGELLAPATQHVAELRAAGHARPAYRFAFTTSRFADFRHHVALADGRGRPHTANGTGTADPAVLAGTLDAATGAVRSAILAYLAARTAATTGTPTKAQLDAYPAAGRALRAAREALAATRAAGFDALWRRAFAPPPQPELPDGVEITHVTGLGDGAAPVDALVLESAEPIRWERTEAVIEVATATVQPLRVRVLDAADVGDPDLGAFRWSGVDAHTDVELRTHLGVVAPRVAGAWTLELSVLEAQRVRVRVAVTDGGTAALTGLGAGAGAAATTGPTNAGGPATLEVTGTALTSARLTGTGMAVLAAEVEQPFEPVPASGPLRLTRGVLPPATGPATHSVDVAAYADTTLAGHRITWTDARTPSVGGDYHVFAPGTSIRDGRTARVYGGVATTPADGAVDLFAGGTVGVLPRTGVVFRLAGPDGRVVHELVTLPDSAFVAAPPVRVWANGDQTRAFLLTGAAVPKGSGRLRLRWLREGDPDLPRLSVGGVSSAESAIVSFHVR